MLNLERKLHSEFTDTLLRISMFLHLYFVYIKNLVHTLFYKELPSLLDIDFYVISLDIYKTEYLILEN